MFSQGLGSDELSGTFIQRDDTTNFESLNDYSGILYTAGLGQKLNTALSIENFTVDKTVNSGNYNVVYNNGLSFILLKGFN